MTEDVRTSKTFELKDLVMAALTALSVGGFTGSTLSGGNNQQAADTAKEIAVLSTKMEAQNRLATQRDEAQAKRISELSSAVEALKALFQAGTTDRYPRTQAIVDLGSLREELREVREDLRRHTVLRGHPQMEAEQVELRRRISELEEDVKQLNKTRRKPKEDE